MDIPANKAKVLQQLQCVICLEGVKDARLCPCCSRFFCNKCIYMWLNTKSSTCPSCRADIRYYALVNGYSINAMHESNTKLVSSLDNNLCDRHDTQQLTLFCCSCKANICTKCWFSGDHAEHKEWVMPLDEAYKVYSRNLQTALIRVNEQRGVINQKLTKLNKERQQIDKLHNDSVALVASEANSNVTPESLMNMVNVVGTITKLRSKQQRLNDAIRGDRRGLFMLKPIILLRLPIIPGAEYLIRSDAHSLWKCTINNKAYPEGDDDCHFCFIRFSLIEGNPCMHSVAIDDQPEKMLWFELNEPVLIGCVNPSTLVDNEAKQVTIQIRQSYFDKIQELQDHIVRLEKECCNEKSLRTNLSKQSSSLSNPIKRQRTNSF